MEWVQPDCFVKLDFDKSTIKLLMVSQPQVPFRALGGHSHFWPENIGFFIHAQTRLVGALIVNPGLLSARISLFLKFAEK